MPLKRPERRSQSHRTIEPIGDFPPNLASLPPDLLNRFPAMAQWQASMERWYFDFRTVLGRIQSQIVTPMKQIQEFDDDLAAQIAALRARVDEIEPAVENLQSRLLVLETTIVQLGAQVNFIRDRQNEMLTTINTIVSDIASLKSTVATILATYATRQWVLDLISSGELTFYQNTPSNIWTITHGFQAFPLIQVFVGGKLVEADHENVSEDQAVIKFSSDLQGYALLRRITP